MNPYSRPGHGHHHRHGILAHLHVTKEAGSDDAAEQEGSANKTHQHADHPTLAQRIKGMKGVPRLLSLALPELPILIIAMLALLVATSITLVIPFAVGFMLDSSDMNRVYQVTVALLLLFLCGTSLTFLRAFLFSIAGESLVARLRKRLFNTIIVQDMAFFDQNRTGELVNRLSADTTIIQTASTITVCMMLRFLIQIIGGGIVLFVISWPLMLAMILPAPILGIVAFLYSRIVRHLSAKAQTALAKATTVSEESISCVRYIRSFGKEEKEKYKYARRVNYSFKIGRAIALAFGLFQAGTELATYSAILLVIFVGAVLVIHGYLTMGSMTSFILYVVYVAHAIGALGNHASEFMKAVGASQRVFELLDHKSSIPTSGGRILSPEEMTTQDGVLIEFENVNFAYPSRANNPVLRNLNLKIQSNKVHALVGPSGVGKTTVVQLILRLYDIQSGSISFGGVPLKELDPRWLRDQIGYVSQELVLFAASIRENISYGLNADTTQEQIEEAARRAYIHDFIQTLPEGYDTVVGERGVQLSGGQKQRMGIARAILKNPPILLLDEATSALDAESEHLVQQALDELVVGRTVLVIAHRMSTVKNAHVVVVMNEGAVVQQGAYDELLKDTQGLFSQLVHRQQAGLIEITDISSPPQPDSIPPTQQSDQVPITPQRFQEQNSDGTNDAATPLVQQC